MTTLADRAVLVTGANRGMGREYVRQLLDRGVARVYAAARDPRSVDVLDPRVVPVALDVTDPASVAAAAKAAPDVSVLINNAGIARGASVLAPDTALLREELETNLFGPLAMAAAFADGIAAQSGAIVNVSSVLAWLPVGASYGVSKAALWSATDSMRIELTLPRCSGGGRLRRSRRHRYGVVRRCTEIRSRRRGAPGSRRRRVRRAGGPGRRDDPRGSPPTGHDAGPTCTSLTNVHGRTAVSERPMMTSWKDTPNRTIDVGGTTFAYRELGTGSGVPVVFLHHLTAVLDDWDPRIIDGIAEHHRVIAFDNRGVGATGSSVPGHRRADGHRRHRLHPRHGARAGRPVRLLPRRRSRPDGRPAATPTRPADDPGRHRAARWGRHRQNGDHRRQGLSQGSAHPQ